MFTKKNPRTPPKKVGKIQKIQGFFWGFKICIPYWEWKTPRITYLNPFYWSNARTPKKNPRILFEELKFVHLIWELIPSISVFKSFLFINFLYTQKNPEKILKNLKKYNKLKDFFEGLKSVHPIWEWITPRIMARFSTDQDMSFVQNHGWSKLHYTCVMVLGYTLHHITYNHSAVEKITWKA